MVKQEIGVKMRDSFRCWSSAMWELNKCILELFLHWYSLDMYIWFISLATKTTKHVHLWQWWANSPSTPFLEGFWGHDIRAIVKSCFFGTMDPTDPNPSQDSNVQRRRRWILGFFNKTKGRRVLMREIMPWDSWMLGCGDILFYVILHHIIRCLYDYNISYIILHI